MLFLLVHTGKYTVHVLTRVPHVAQVSDVAHELVYQMVNF